MEADEDDDMHMCLVCHITIKGIVNYVTHKKTECTGKRNTKGREPQILSNKITSTAEVKSNVTESNLPQAYSHNQPFGPTFAEFNTTTSSHNEIIDFATAQFNTDHGEGVNKASSLDNILYSGAHIKTGALFDTQGTTSNSQSNLGIPIPTSLNLSPSIFRPDHSNEDHGLLDGCITRHLESGFTTAIGYQVLNSNPVQTTNSSTMIMSDMTVNPPNKEEDNQNRTASEKVDDFFQSLELMSKNDPRAEKGAGFGQPLANLPISNILSNLTFSSDEEEFNFDFADDVSFDSLSDDSDIDSNKVKIGEPISSSMKNRPRFRGKWPPGLGPAVNTSKHQQRPIKGGKKFPPETFKKTVKSQGKLKQHSQIKPFACSICDLDFTCRFKYSNHFGTSQHKQNLQKRRSERMETRRPFKSGRGKSFKLIREVNKQFENDPFTQPFVSENSNDFDKKSETIDKEQVHDVMVFSKDSKVTFIDASIEIKNDQQKENKNIPIQNENQESLSNKEETGTDNLIVDSDKSSGTNLKKTTVEGQNIEIDTEDKTQHKDSNNVNKESQVCQENSLDEEPMYRAVPLYICTICDKKYPNKYYLSRHLITKPHRNRALANPKEGFYLLQMYHKYILRLSPYQCAICRFYFNNYDEFLRHLESYEHAETQESLVAETMCSLCMFRTHYNEDLLKHVKTEEHVNNIRSKKKICIIKESHIKCKCKYCGLGMNSYTRLKRHVVLKHKDKEIVSGVVKRKIGVRNRPECTLCSKQFASKSTLELHMRRRHTKDRPYKCHECNKDFSDKFAFLGHQRTSRHLNKVLTGRLVEDEEKTLVQNKKTAHSADTSLFKITDVRSGIKIEHTAETLDIDRQKDYPGNTGDSASFKDDRSTQKQTILEIATSKGTNDNFEGNKTELNYSATRFETFKPETAKTEKKKTKRRRRKNTELASTKSKTYKCNHCSFTVTAYNDLRPHYLKEHAAQTIICELCDIVFLSDKAMKLHVLSKEHQENIKASNPTTEEEIKYFECHICKKKFTDEKYCKFHTAYQHFHVTSEEAVIRECGEKSITREKYKEALADMEHQPNSARIECPECKVFFKKPNFLEHLRIHTGEKPFKCKMCPKAFMASVTLRKHLLGHFGCQERTCEVCNKHFKKTSSYEEHKQVHEAEKSSAEKMHVCDTCGLSFYLVRQLQNHIRRHKDKEFKCTVPGCHWKFLFANELKYHMRSHSKHKPFLCDICGYSATSKCRLSRHHKTHTGERNYHCEYCSYKAGNSTHLHRHMRIHIGSKPFKCPYCEYSCNTHENMRKHIVQTKKHIGLKIYPCRFCEYSTNSCAEFRNHLTEMHEKDLGPDVLEMTGLSKFTGLYNKDLDPKQPMEGNKIHQVRERTPRVKKGADGVGGAKKKEKSKGKGNKQDKPQSASTLVLMDKYGHTKDVATILLQNEVDSISEEKTPGISHLHEVKPGFPTLNSGDGRYQEKPNPPMDRFNVTSSYKIQSLHSESKPGKLEVKVNTSDIGNTYAGPGQLPIIGSYDDSSARDLTFGQTYAVYSPENVQKQALMSINAPLNYRSLLKTSMPSYQGYNTYSDHRQLHGAPSHDYNGPYAGHQVPMFPGNRGDSSVGMMPENLTRIDESAASYSGYSSKNLRGNQEDVDQQRPGNLVIDMEFEKKHLI